MEHRGFKYGILVVNKKSELGVLDVVIFQVLLGERSGS